MPLQEENKDWTALPNVLLFGGSDRGPLNILDNFYQHPFNVDSLSYSTVEHYFQSAKFIDSDPEYAEKIRWATDGAEAKKLGGEKRLSREVLDKWKEGGSTDAMKKALRAKFSLDPRGFGKQLLELTGDKILVEKVEDDPTWDDKTWGAGKDGVGLNRMGVLLTNLRDELKAQA